MSAFMRLLLWHGQKRRSFLVCVAGAQDGCVVTLFKSPWLIHPSGLLVSSNGGRSSGEIRCSSSSVWRGSSVSTNASVESGEGLAIEQVWEEYFADPLQWWDKRFDKKNPKSPDFKHKVTRKALWVDGWSTPPWVKAVLNKLVAQGKLQPHVGHHTSDSQETIQANKLLKCDVGIRNELPANARGLSQTVQGGNVKMHIQSAKTMSEAVVVLKNGLQQGLAIDSYTYVEVLKWCSKEKDLVAGKQVHDCIIKSGMEHNTFVANNLLNVYIRCGRLQDARGVFDELTKKSIISWNVMIGGYAQHNCAKDAMEVFKKMCQEGVQADEITYLSILKACASPEALKRGEEVHAYVRHGGFESDVRVGTALLKMYAQCGSIKEARKTFDKLASRNVISWNSMIGAYAESGCGLEAYQLVLQMIQEGFKPDRVTFLSILNPCASAGALEWVKEVHNHIVEAGLLDSDLWLGNALVHMYAKSGSIDDARLVFHRMGKRDVWTWTAMIGGLALHGYGHEAVELFKNMTAAGVKPDGTSFVAVLSACSHAGLVDVGRELFVAMSQDYGIQPSVVHCNCMVDLLGRAGHLEEAKLFIDNMPVEPNASTWGALLSACKTHSNVELGEFAAEKRVKLDPKDASTYVLLSNLYAAADKWQEVSRVRTRMQERGICKPPGRSWIEVDNKVHAFVVGDTSHPESDEIYAELSRLTDEIKVAGYLPDTRLVLRNNVVDEEDKEFALCSHSEKLAIAYGLMHSSNREKPIRVFKNLRVCTDCHTATKFISKVTRKEIIVRDNNRFHHFKDGACSCKDYW